MGDYRTDLDYWMDAWEEFEKNISVPAKSSPSLPQTDDDYYNDYLESEQDALIQEGRTANPVYPDSIRKDSDAPKSSWVQEDFLKEIELLKRKLFDLENKMARLGQGKSPPKKPKSDKQEDLMREIETTRKKIDKVSNGLGTEDEPEISMRKIP